MNDKELSELFYQAEESLIKLSTRSKKEIKSYFDYFKNINSDNISWEDAYNIMMFVAFYSGFKAETVNAKRTEINKALGSLKKVATFKERDIKVLMKNEKIIRHESKIRACVFNANVIIKLKKEYKTFQNYLDSFGDLNQTNNINILIKSLSKSFKYLGRITVNHFLTDIGINVAKPDRVLCRIFYRLGIVKSITSFNDVIKACRQISKTTR